MIIEYEGVKPKIGLNVFIAPTATVIGDVEIKDNASIWLWITNTASMLSS